MTMAGQTFGRSQRDPKTPKVGKNANSGIKTGMTNSAAGSERNGNAPRGGTRGKLNA
jgi:hypothetical protein